MPRSVDHGPSLIRLSISNCSYFRHLRQNRIHDGCHGGGHLESLQLLTVSEPLVGWSRNMVEGIRETERFSTAKMIKF